VLGHGRPAHRGEGPGDLAGGDLVVEQQAQDPAARSGGEGVVEVLEVIGEREGSSWAMRSFDQDGAAAVMRATMGADGGLTFTGDQMRAAVTLTSAGAWVTEAAGRDGSVVDTPPGRVHLPDRFEATQLAVTADLAGVGTVRFVGCLDARWEP
jgi:hypothetical protein